jgi:hypothetical protein
VPAAGARKIIKNKTENKKETYIPPIYLSSDFSCYYKNYRSMHSACLKFLKTRYPRSYTIQNVS